MRVSVIIPVYNGAAYLAAALDSVFAQSYAPLEIIAVDDGSTDSSPDILRSCGERLRVIRQGNQGVAVARNTGFANATGELICFLDQDDLWPVDRTRLLVEALRADPEAQLATGLTEILYERPTQPGPLDNFTTFRREFLLGSICIRAGLLRSLGPFSTGVGYADDTDFWMRRKEAKIKAIDLDAVTLIYRLHGENTSSDKERTYFYLMGAIRESLKRRRNNKEGKAYDLQAPGRSDATDDPS
jgi:glycosyltransferase involved in cell wall biosynthesis